MSLHLTWPTTWDVVFVERLRSMLQSRLRAAMRRLETSALPLRGNVTVQQLFLGDDRPSIVLRKVMEATPKRVMLEVDVRYAGDAFVAVTGLEVNFDLTAAYLTAPQSPSDALSHSTALRFRGGDANHALPCWIAFDGKITNVEIEGTFIIEIVHTFEAPRPPPLSSSRSKVSFGVRLPPKIREIVAESTALRNEEEGHDSSSSNLARSSLSVLPAAAGGARPHHNRSWLASPTRGQWSYGFTPGVGLAAAVSVSNSGCFLPPRPMMGGDAAAGGTGQHGGRENQHVSTEQQGGIYGDSDAVRPASFIGMLLASRGHPMGAASPRVTSRVLRIRSVGDPLRGFYVESNFNAMVGDQLTSLLRVLIAPVIRQLMSSGFDVELPVA